MIILLTFSFLILPLDIKALQYLTTSLGNNFSLGLGLYINSASSLQLDPENIKSSSDVIFSL